MDIKSVDVKTLDIVFFDCEMTGLELRHELIEIGYVKARAQTFEFISEGDIKILPTRLTEADPAALAINNYKAEEWAKEGVDLKTGLEKFLAVTEGCMLSGQNVSMDILFLRKSMAEVGLIPNFFYKPLDTFSIAFAKFRSQGGFRRFSLEELAKYLKIDQGQAHRAIDDARTTYQVFKKLLNG